MNYDHEKVMFDLGNSIIKIAIIGCLVLLVGWGAVVIYRYFTPFGGLTIQQKIAALPQELKLKTNASDVVFYESIDELSCNDRGLKCFKTGNKIKHYIYLTNVPIKTTYKGLTEDISLRNNNTQVFKDGDKITYKIYSGYPFYKKNGRWYQIGGATTTIEAFNLQVSLIDIVRGFVFRGKQYQLIKEAYAENFNAGAGDGYIYAENTVWATARSQADGSGADYNSGNAYEVRAETFENEAEDMYYIMIAYVPVDTSGLADDADITASSFWIKPNFIDASAPEESLTIVKTTQASPTSLVVGDYDERGGLTGVTEYSARVAQSAFTDETYKEIPLTDLTIISKIAYTYVGVRSSRDIDDTTPPLDDNSETWFYNSQNAGSQPYLEITVAGGVTSVPNKRAIWMDF